jgi:phosphoglycolate phosphatase-like HAD superfamily hydrolase
MQDGALLAASDIGVEIRSALPGRFRIWVAGLYRNEDLEHILERGLNGSASRRRVFANSIAATVLVEAPTDVSPHALVGEIAALVRQFAQERSTSLEELERRGRNKPSHLAVNGAARDPSTFFSLVRPKDGRAKAKGASPVGQEQAVQLWHALDASQVAEILRVPAEGGLLEEEAQARLARFGSNDLTQVVRRSGLSMFLDQFKELPVALLAGLDRAFDADGRRGGRSGDPGRHRAQRRDRVRYREPREARSDSRKLMATLHRRSEASGYLVAVKGSPMEVLDLCKTRLVAGQVVSMSEPERRVIRRQNERMAGDPLRVLGLAYAEHLAEPSSCDQGLIWLGLSGLADPPRKGLPELFDKFRRAGVRSVMITGDQSATAYAIAQQIGLAEDGELRTLDSVELENMDPDLLADIAPRVQVFSRVSPRHKLRIVQALQRSGLVVAMTGDGINDCPALQAADIGVAMGGDGGAAAREVADVIPAARRWFGSTVMPPMDWAVAAFGAVAPLIANEVVKAARVASERRSELSESSHSTPRGLRVGH